MKKPSKIVNPEANRFVVEIINDVSRSKEISSMNFRELVDHGISKGYKFSDAELLKTLSTYYENKITLPHWLEKRLGGLAIWAAWEDRH